MNNWSQDKYLKAFRFAAEKHKGQLFPGTDWSYVVHLSMVSMEIIAALNYETNIDGDLAVQVAILHDTIEDTDTTYEELKSNFGQKVADGVRSLTKEKDKNNDQTQIMADSLRRIKFQAKEIWMVKLADRVTNMQPPPSHWSNEKRKKYLNQAKTISHELKDASIYLSKRLQEKIQNYKKYIVFDDFSVEAQKLGFKQITFECQPTCTTNMEFGYKIKIACNGKAQLTNLFIPSCNENKWVLSQNELHELKKIIDDSDFKNPQNTEYQFYGMDIPIFKFSLEFPDGSVISVKHQSIDKSVPDELRILEQKINDIASTRINFLKKG